MSPVGTTLILEPPVKQDLIASQNRQVLRTRSSDSYSATSCFRAASSSAFCAGSIFGYESFSALSASTTAAATTSRVNHLLSAGTTYQGACGLAVFWIMSSYAF